MKRKSDLSYGLFCMAMSLLFLFWLIPANTPKSSIAGDLSSAALPNAMMEIIFICGLAMTVKSLAAAARHDGKNGKDGEDVSGQCSEPGGRGRLAVILFVLLGYLLAMNYIGFYVVTALALPAALKYYNRAMAWGKILAGTGILLACVYLLFEMGLSVTMPRGLLF